MPNNPNAVDNLVHWPKGVSGNLNGRPKNRRSLATIVRDLEDEDFDWSNLPIKGKGKEAIIAMGSPWKAIVVVALGQAAAGSQQARDWLRKSGYGDKLDLTTGGEPLQPATVVDLGALRDV